MRPHSLFSNTQYLVIAKRNSLIFQEVSIITGSENFYRSENSINTDLKRLRKQIHYGIYSASPIFHRIVISRRNKLSTVFSLVFFSEVFLRV